MSYRNILAIDLAKEVFQICKTDHNGKVIYNKAVSRRKLQEILRKEKASLAAMESCATSHYWCRYAMECGHAVKPMHARTVKAFLTKQKTDKNDALAISIAALQPHVPSTRILNTEEQALQSVDRMRELAVSQRRSCSNQIRSLLNEFGITIAKGIAHLKAKLPDILEDAENGLPGMFRQSIAMAFEMLKTHIEYIADLDKKLEAEVKNNETCQKLMMLEGVGPLSAIGLTIRLGQPAIFKNGRAASASIGLTPKQHSSGGKEVIGHIAKYSADKRLRSTLYQGALAVIARVDKREARTQKEVWLKGIIQRRGKKVAAIALANKNVRTTYALIKNNTNYKATAIAA